MTKKTTTITILTILILTIIVGGFWYYLRSQNNADLTRKNAGKTEKVKVVENNIGDKKEEKNDEQKTEELKVEDIDTSNWKEYCNKEYGFCVKYPEGWEVVLNGKDLLISPIKNKKINYNLLIISIKKNGNIENFVNNYGKTSPEINGKKLSRIVDRSSYAEGNLNGEKLIATTDIGVNKKFIVIFRKNDMFVFSYNDIDLYRNEIENIILTFSFM